MNNRVGFWTTFVLALIGALSWIPVIIDDLKSSELQGKLISIYANSIENDTKAMLLFKLSIYSKNKPFQLKNISCEVKFDDGKIFLTEARNNRWVVFTWDTTCRLLLTGQDYLNNRSLLPANENIAGYLFFKFNGNFGRQWQSVTFIFEPFDGKIQKLSFAGRDINKERIFFDESIWQPIDLKASEYHRKLK